jgi:hypothetical protein
MNDDASFGWIFIRFRRVPADAATAGNRCRRASGRCRQQAGSQRDTQCHFTKHAHQSPPLSLIHDTHKPPQVINVPKLENFILMRKWQAIWVRLFIVFAKTFYIRHIKIS